MNTTWKYELEITDRQRLRVPLGTKPVAVAEQNGKLCLWAQVNDDHYKTGNLETLFVYVVGTGNPLPSPLPPYVGTVVMDPFVWHVYAGDI